MKQGMTALRYLASTIAISIALSLVSFAQQATAQTPAPTVKEYPSSRVEGLVKEWTRARDYTKEYLDAMPDEGYAFKPSPDIRTFAEQMLHLAAGNYGIGSRATAAANPMQGKNIEKDEAKTKGNVTKVVLESYDYVIASVKTLTDAKLDERMPLAGFNRPRLAVINGVFEHQTHHRGQTTIYLRLKGVQPPQEKLF